MPTQLAALRRGYAEFGKKPARLIPMKAPLSLGMFADTINDAGSTRTVYLLAAGLALLGAALLAVTISFWRSSKPEPQLLAPLEVMENKKFRRMGRMEQKRLLDSVRPPDAQPINKSVVIGAPTPQPEVDLRALGRARPATMDDLRESESDAPLAEPPADPTANDGIAIDPLLRMFDRDEI